MKYRYRYAQIRIQIGLALALAQGCGCCSLFLFVSDSFFLPLWLSLFLYSILVFLFEFFCVNLPCSISAKGSTCPLFTAVLCCSLPAALCSAPLLSALPSFLAKNCAKNQFCLLFFCHVFLAKTNPHASPIAISLCCVSLPLFLPARLRQCSVRFASGIVSFFFLFFFLLCFVETSYHLPPGWTAACLNCLSPVSLPLPCPCPCPASLCFVFVPTLYASEPWDFISCKKVEVLGRFLLSLSLPLFPSFTVLLSLSLLLLLTCRCFARTHIHTHAQLMRIGNKERRRQLVNYKFRSVFGLFFGCFVAYLHKLAAQLMGII